MMVQSWLALLAASVLLTHPCEAAAPPAETPYQASAAGSNCAGKNACTIQMPAIPVSQRATIQHVSCNATFTNFQALYLTTLTALSAPTVADSLTSLNYTINANGSAESIVDSPTQFSVSGEDTPVLTLAGSGPFAGEPACFVSGTLTRTAGKLL